MRFRIVRFKGRAASATARGVRIIDAKAGAGQSFGKIYGRAAEILRAENIHQNAHAVALDHFVALFHRVQRHAVLHSGASARFHENPQSFAITVGMLGEQGLKLFDGGIRYDNHGVFKRYQNARLKSNRAGRSQMMNAE
jgi:hypothetical protein